MRASPNESKVQLHAFWDNGRADVASVQDTHSTASEHYESHRCIGVSLTPRQALQKRVVHHALFTQGPAPNTLTITGANARACNHPLNHRPTTILLDRPCRLHFHLWGTNTLSRTNTPFSKLLSHDVRKGTPFTIGSRSRA